MIEQKIVLKTLEDVREFVAGASEKNYDIELLSGKYIVNAKSVMGVLSLDLTAPLTMVANVDEDNALLEQVEKFKYVPPKQHATV
ncbi:MAG: HPr family phosphocarrier protein [Clostridia bacterium]|nr:HPr family phosphocarrier protein [Clostridia bacterium]